MTTTSYKDLPRGTVLRSRNEKLRYVFLSWDPEHSLVKVMPYIIGKIKQQFVWETSMIHLFQVAPVDEQIENSIGPAWQNFNMKLYRLYLDEKYS